MCMCSFGPADKFFHRKIYTERWEGAYAKRQRNNEFWMHEEEINFLNPQHVFARLLWLSLLLQWWLIVENLFSNIFSNRIENF